MNPLDKLKKKRAINILPKEIQMLLKFSKWIDYDLNNTGNLTTKAEYQIMNDWLYNYIKNNFGLDENIANDFSNEKEFVSFGFKFIGLWNKQSLRDMKMFTAYNIKVINGKYTMVRK